MSGDVSGKLTVDQFGNILTSVLGVGYGPLILMCKFVDSDGDGLISHEDIMLAQARIHQRSPEFLKILFRAYVDSVWYPGRNINHVSKSLKNLLKYMMRWIM